VEIVGPSNVSVIKKGSAIFNLKFGFINFRDSQNYCGPASLAKFASMFKLDISKQLFPYEKFSTINEIKSQIKWPDYPDFVSKLGTSYTFKMSDLSNMLEKRFFATFGELLDYYKLNLEGFSDCQRASVYLPTLSNEQIPKLERHFNISPIDYFQQKIEYDQKISSGEYETFCCYLVEYNLMDCRLLTQAMSRFIKLFKNCFRVCLFDKLSLPGISEQIMWQHFDGNCPKMFSFDESYGFLNERIREKLQGGPTIIMHRHIELAGEAEKFIKEVHYAENGDSFKKVVSYDYNALYAFTMKQDLPTGIPFYMEKQDNGKFEFKIACSQAGWSHDALDWINFMSYDNKFMKPDGGFYEMISVVTGEHQLIHEGSVYSVDGVVRTPDKTYFLEFFGCR